MENRSRILWLYANLGVYIATENIFHDMFVKNLVKLIRAQMLMCLAYIQVRKQNIHKSVTGISMWIEVMWFTDLLLSPFSPGNYDYELS